MVHGSFQTVDAGAVEEIDYRSVDGPSTEILPPALRRRDVRRHRLRERRHHDGCTTRVLAELETRDDAHRLFARRAQYRSARTTAPEGLWRDRRVRTI